MATSNDEYKTLKEGNKNVTKIKLGIKNKEISLNPDIDILDPIKNFIHSRSALMFSTVSGIYLVIITELIKDIKIRTILSEKTPKEKIEPTLIISGGKLSRASPVLYFILLILAKVPSTKSIKRTRHINK